MYENHEQGVFILLKNEEKNNAEKTISLCSSLIECGVSCTEELVLNRIARRSEEELVEDALARIPASSQHVIERIVRRKARMRSDYARHMRLRAYNGMQGEEYK